MKWSDMRIKYPDKFILIGDIKEEKISDKNYRILAGKILKISDNAKEIREYYKDYKNKGMNVVYSLPGTPDEFIVEDVPFMGILR